MSLEEDKLKNKFLMLSVITVVLASLMVSTIPVPVAAVVTKGWHKATLAGELCDYFGIDDWQFIEAGETGRYEYYVEKFTFRQVDDIILTLTERHDKTKSLETGWTMLSMSYQDTCGLGLYFTGMKGTLYVTEEYDGSNPYYVSTYELSGLGIGSYGPKSRFGDAFVRGTIHLVASDLDNSYDLIYNFVVTYYA
jgi:hypothetical protein